MSPLVAETWGRPIEHAWCGGGYQVVNVVNVNLAGIVWNEQDDHSKWVLAGNEYACFGDMNRMSSQWKRGGLSFAFQIPLWWQRSRELLLHMIAVDSSPSILSKLIDKVI